MDSPYTISDFQKFGGLIASKTISQTQGGDEQSWCGYDSKEIMGSSKNWIKTVKANQVWGLPYLSRSRQRACIIRELYLAEMVLKTCPICRINNRKLFKQLMADIPDHQLQPYLPLSL